MALHRCVKCGQVQMLWSIDEEISKYTYWSCANCKELVAWEDESKQRDCTECGRTKGQMFMWNKEEAFWFCFSCNKKLPYNGTKPEWIEM